MSNFLVLGGCSVALGLAIVGFRADDETGHGISFGERLQQVGYGLVGVYGPIQYTNDRVADLVYLSSSPSAWSPPPPPATWCCAR
ncbi:hypothetical protein NKH77_40355 [Streptomyces sp. M19]